MSRRRSDFPELDKIFLRKPEKVGIHATLILRQLMSEARSKSLPAHLTREGYARDAGFQERVVALYEAHRDGIYRFLVGHGLNPATAQDVTQDVFVDLFVAL